MTKEELKAEIENLEGIKLAQETALNKEYNIVEQLQKENEELKEQCSILADCNTCTSTCKTENVEMKKQLTKAKEHIRTLISCLMDWVQEGDKDYCHIAEAEQFLKEV